MSVYKPNHPQNNDAMMQFARWICIRKYHDPLTVAWLVYTGNRNFGNIDQIMLLRRWEIFDWDHPDKSLRMLHGKSSGACSTSDEFIANGAKLGLWKRSMDTNNMTVKVLPSNKFINRTCQFAFVILCRYMCKDVARIITRMIASMHLEDRKWLHNLDGKYTYAMCEELIRDRICKRLGIAF
jgi:hypothetical protein